MKSSKIFAARPLSYLKHTVIAKCFESDKALRFVFLKVAVEVEEVTKSFIL